VPFEADRRPRVAVHGAATCQPVLRQEQSGACATRRRGLRADVPAHRRSLSPISPLPAGPVDVLQNSIAAKIDKH